MNENVRQKEGKAFRPWCEDEFITKVELPGIRQDQDRAGDPNAISGISGRENRRKLKRGLGWAIGLLENAAEKILTVKE